MKINTHPVNPFLPLPKRLQWLYATVAFILIAFGQPALVPAFGLLASAFGYALFWRVLICNNTASQRFLIAAAWFFSVQLVQLAWFISHPYLYIYAVYFLLSTLFAVQFAIIAIFINPRMLKKTFRLIAISTLWVLLEWSRLYLLSGFSFNQVGIALTGATFPLQMASLLGVFGLSFWVILTNLLALRAWMKQWKLPSTFLWLAAAILPYVFGLTHLFVHEHVIQPAEQQPNSPFKAVLVQTAFPVEESIDFNTKKNMIQFVIDEWRQILEITKKHKDKEIDLIALPEFVVPFGTYANIYPLNDVIDVFREVFGTESLAFLPAPGWPFGDIIEQSYGKIRMVNNAYWVQSIANLFQTNVIAGLEDAEDNEEGEREYYSAALFFKPKPSNIANLEPESAYPKRYEKRILVPMGEYIPFSFCRELAKQYGVFGSFTPGKEAKVMNCAGALISPSICYEETFGDLMREGRQKGADILVNLTSDVWYPNSSLPLQHMEHARLRTVENGVPLLRACNTGVTAGLDSFGRCIAVLGGDNPEKVEWIPDSLYVEVPTYTYSTLYSKFGDSLIIGFSFIITFMGCCFRQFFT